MCWHTSYRSLVTHLHGYNNCISEQLRGKKKKKGCKSYEAKKCSQRELSDCVWRKLVLSFFVHTSGYILIFQLVWRLRVSFENTISRFERESSEGLHFLSEVFPLQLAFSKTTTTHWPPCNDASSFQVLAHVDLLIHKKLKRSGLFKWEKNFSFGLFRFVCTVIFCKVTMQ